MRWPFELHLYFPLRVYFGAGKELAFGSLDVILLTNTRAFVDEPTEQNFCNAQLRRQLIRTGLPSSHGRGCLDVCVSARAGAKRVPLEQLSALIHQKRPRPNMLRQSIATVAKEANASARCERGWGRGGREGGWNSISRLGCPESARQVSEQPAGVPIDLFSNNFIAAIINWCSLIFIL